MASDPTSAVRSYLDFGGLAQLKGQAGQADNPAVLRRTAEQFEAHFIQTLMKTMREATVLRGELLESQAEDTYQDMMDKELAQLMSRRSALGIADLLERQLAGGGVTPTAPSTHQVLALRSAGMVRGPDQDPK